MEGLAQLGFNVNWLLTGNGAIRISEEENLRLTYEDAHRQVREWIRKQPGKFDRLTINFGDQDESSVINQNQLRSYVYDDGYIPTNHQMIELCRRLNLDDEKLLKTLLNSDIKLKIATKKIDLELLKCTIEAIENKKFIKSKIAAKEKAELVRFVYSMNIGTNYSTEKLIRFTEAVFTIIDQVGDLSSLTDAQLNNAIIQIAHHVVRGSEK